MFRSIQKKAENSGLLVLDGPRGSGKSTLGMQIVESLNQIGYNAEYFKKGLRQENEFTNMVTHLRMWTSVPNRILVADRFVATEWVMSTYYERVESRTLFRWCNEVDDMLLQLDAVHAILLPELETLSRRIEQRQSRNFDMDPMAVRPLWRAAHGFMKSSIMYAPETAENFTVVAGVLMTQLQSRVLLPHVK